MNWHAGSGKGGPLGRRPFSRCGDPERSGPATAWFGEKVGSLMRVLIADDDPIALELLRDALTDAGHEVSSAGDGVQALELLGRDPCQVLITDWEMPRLDGIGL